MERKPKALTVLNWLAGAVFAVALYTVLIWAPQEAIMGDVQRVFYFHVAAGWVGMLAFLVTAIVGGIYLARGEKRWDRVAQSSVEIGVVFAFINIVTGAIWARPIWNTWWTWDPRLVTATIMELIYLAYMMLRRGIEDPDRRARFGAVYSIVGFISVPLTFLSIRIFRTIHPIVVGSSDPAALGAFDMTGNMRVAFFFSLFTFTLVYITLLWHRLRLQHKMEEIEERKLRALSA
ncbi:MAG: cytochrome c biogenesis protein CcsA [Anaerolineales bacterium]|nr:cytochrome c biogenesis protein CcsA [Anaerolineales bacterium]